MRRTIEADALLARLTQLHHRASARSGARRIELFHRAAVTLRVGRRDERGSLTTHEGFEEGTAVRLENRAGRHAFSAGSGSGESVTERLIAAALDRPWGAGVPGAPWAAATPAEPRDHDEHADLPAPDDLARWLEDAIDRLAACGDGVRTVRCGVEAALTVETLVGAGGLAASRVRSRVWATARILRPGAAGQREAHHAAAARSLGALPVDGWALDLPPEVPGRGRPDGRRLPLVLPPPPAAALVQALVGALHAPGAAPGRPVGAGWRVTEDPRAAGALLGTTFDDAGFPTRARRLADGGSVVGSIGSEGFLRRASFRDPPVPTAACLRIEPGSDAPPPRARLAGSLRIHPLDDEWLLELETTDLEDRRPITPWQELVLRETPESLVRRCAAAAGPPRSTHLGVVTPALVLDY